MDFPNEPSEARQDALAVTLLSGRLVESACVVDESVIRIMDIPASPAPSLGPGLPVLSQTIIIVTIASFLNMIEARLASADLSLAAALAKLQCNASQPETSYRQGALQQMAAGNGTGPETRH